MPAGVPPAGLDRRFLLADRILRNTGADSSVNYQVAARNADNGDIFIGGNNDYVGLMTRGLYGELVQGANLPPTNNTMLGGAWNKSGGGWLVMDGLNAIFKNNSNDLSAAWATITPPPATSRDDIVEYNGALLSYTAVLGGPQRDIEFSIDDGATWDTNPGDNTGIGTNGSRIVTNPAQTRLLVASSGGANVATTTDQGLPPYTWTLLPINTLGIPQIDAAISDDGTKGVVIASTNGQIWVSDGFTAAGSQMIPDNNNPFVSSVFGSSLVSVQYVAAMQGFVIISSIGPSCAFIPESDMTQIFVGNYIGGAVTLGVRAHVSDGEQALFAGNNNEAMATLRNIGQLSKT